MPFDGNGHYSLPAGNPVVTGTVINSTTTNNTLADIAAALSTTLTKDGQSTPTGNLPMGGFKHTGAANGVGSGDYATIGQLAASGGSALSGFLQSGTGAVSRTSEAKMRERVTPDDFYLSADGSNWYPALSRAVASGAKLVTVRAGQYTLDNSVSDKLSNMIVCGNVTIHFEEGAVLNFTYNGLPLLVWCNATTGGITGHPTFVYTGATQTTDDYTLAQFRARLGLTTFVAGGAYELRTVLMRVNSENVHFGDKLVFRSATAGDSTKGICFCINDKGMEDTATQANYNSIGEADFEDCIHGVLSSRQKHFSYSGPFRSRRRFGIASVAPGHILYFSGGGPNGLLSDGYVGDVTDLGEPTTTADGFCIASLAIKGVERCRFGRVVSHHPEGLVQTFDTVTDSEFGPMTWNYTGSYRTTVGAQLNFAGTGAISGNVFAPITLNAPNTWASLVANSTLATLFQNNTFECIRVRCQHNFTSGSRAAVVDIFGLNNKFAIEWEPTDAATASSNYPFDDRSSTTGNEVRVRLLGPNVSKETARVNTTGTSSKVLFERAIVGDGKNQGFSKGAYLFANPLHYSYQETAAANTTGARTATMQLPGRGSYLVSVMVADNTNTELQAATFQVTYTDYGTDVTYANQIGTTQTLGTKVSALAATVSASGLVTFAYTKSTAFFERISAGYICIALLGD